MQISYKLVGSGWSECIIETAEIRVELSASYLSDALGNLVLSAAAIGSGFHAAEFGFDEEPGEYRWSVQLVENNLVRLRVLEFQELWGCRPTEEGKLLVDISCTPLAYAQAVEACASAVLKEYGLKGYAERWDQHPFPSEALQLLQSSIARRTK